MEEMDRRVTRLEALVLGDNGTPGLSERMRRIEAWQERQDKRTARLEGHAETTEQHTHEILGGWRVAKWFVMAGIPMLLAVLAWIAQRLQEIGGAS